MEQITVAALFVDPRGVYSGLEDVEVWDESRDARLYAGPWPVVAHPPCSRWCRLAGVVEGRYGYKRGDDGGCFEAALRAVRTWGGVLEHPAWSDAWPYFGLPTPMASGWTAESGLAMCACPTECDCANPEAEGCAAVSNHCPIHNLTPLPVEGCPVHARDLRGWVCEVSQAAYGHRARKLTWLYYVGTSHPPSLNWSRPKATHVVGHMNRRGDGTRFKLAGRRLHPREAATTPIPFRDLLLSIARSATVAATGAA